MFSEDSYRRLPVMAVRWLLRHSPLCLLASVRFVSRDAGLHFSERCRRADGAGDVGTGARSNGSYMAPGFEMSPAALGRRLPKVTPFGHV